jgi:hypothetical protein
MALSAFASVHRGLVNTRANWELIFFQWLQVLLVTVLSVAGLLPPLMALGFSRPSDLVSTVSDWPAMLGGATELVDRGRDAWLLLLASLVVASAIWFVATMVYCYFQGGIYGILMSGDRQAPSGTPQGSQWFKTFSCRDLRGWGSHFMWRYFWLLNLVVAVSMAWLVLPIVLVLASFWGSEIWDGGAGFVIGCAGAIPVAFSLLILLIWAYLVQATLAAQDGGVWQATRSSLRILGRRLGAVLFIFFLVILGSGFVSFGIWVISTAGTLMLSRWEFVGLAWQLALTMIQWIFTTAVGIASAAALVGLVRSEISGEPA